MERKKNGGVVVVPVVHKKGGGGPVSGTTERKNNKKKNTTLEEKNVDLRRQLREEKETSEVHQDKGNDSSVPITKNMYLLRQNDSTSSEHDESSRRAVAPRKRTRSSCCPKHISTVSIMTTLCLFVSGICRYNVLGLLCILQALGSVLTCPFFTPVTAKKENVLLAVVAAYSALVCVLHVVQAALCNST